MGVGNGKSRCEGVTSIRLMERERQTERERERQMERKREPIGLCVFRLNISFLRWGIPQEKTT